MPFIVGGAYAKALATRKDPRHFLFFPRNAEGRTAAKEYFVRLAERTADLDRPISRQAGLLNCVPSPPAGCTPTTTCRPSRCPSWSPTATRYLDGEHSADMGRRLPDAKLIVYPNSGHGGVFQHHQEFVPDVLAFLAG